MTVKLSKLFLTSNLIQTHRKNDCDNQVPHKFLRLAKLTETAQEKMYTEKKLTVFFKIYNKRAGFLKTNVKELDQILYFRIHKKIGFSL